jgi:hypothetical protein
VESKPCDSNESASFSSAGVSPAISLISIHQQYAGGTPALQNPMKNSFLVSYSENSLESFETRAGMLNASAMS